MSTDTNRNRIYRGLKASLDSYQESLREPLNTKQSQISYHQTLIDTHMQLRRIAQAEEDDARMTALNRQSDNISDSQATLNRLASQYYPIKDKWDVASAIRSQCNRTVADNILRAAGFTKGDGKTVEVGECYMTDKITNEGQSRIASLHIGLEGHHTVSGPTEAELFGLPEGTVVVDDVRPVKLSVNMSRRSGSWQTGGASVVACPNDPHPSNVPDAWTRLQLPPRAESTQSGTSR